MSVRQFLDNHITHTYGATAEYPWASAPSYGVYRHSHNKKWFAVIMDIPASKLGLENDEIISIVNLKCDPILIGSLHKDNGIYPAYHMNKRHWISVLLGGSVPMDFTERLIEKSYDLTDKKRKISAK